jgi:hypothetical protein
MDARGLVAVIITVHETALILGGLVFAFIGLVSLLVFHKQPARRRTLLSLAFGLGCGLLAYGISARIAAVAPLDVEVVRVSPP